MSDDRRKFILLGSPDQEHDQLISAFNGQVVEEGEAFDFILADKMDNVSNDLLNKPLILTTEPSDFSNFLAHNGEVSLDPSLLSNEIAKHLLVNYSKSKKGIYQNFVMNNLLEYQNSFKVIDFGRLGFYADIIHLEAHEHNFNPVKLRTFLDHTLLFFNYLTQQTKGSFPIEIDVGRNKGNFLLSVTLRNQGVDKKVFEKMFQPIKNSGSENSLLSLICSSSDLLDIQVDKKSIKISGLWDRERVKKQNSLIFLYDLNRKVDLEEQSVDNYDPEINSYDKETHYKRLEAIKDKPLPSEEGETLDYRNLKISAKFLEELALYTFKTLKPQFINDLNEENLRHVLEGFPEQAKTKNLKNEDCEKIILLVKELGKGTKVLENEDGSLNEDDFVQFFSMTEDDNFLVRVKGFIESEDPYQVVSGAIEPLLDKLVSDISVDHIQEDIIRVKGREPELLDTISRTLKLPKLDSGDDHWVVKGLAQYLSNDDFPESDLEKKVRDFISKVQKSSESETIKKIKPRLKELSEDWAVKSLGEVREEISRTVSGGIEGNTDAGDKAIETLSDLLLTDDDKIGNEEGLLRAANAKLSQQKEFYKRSNTEDKKQIVSLREEIENLKDIVRRKDLALRKEQEFNESNPEVDQLEEVDDSRYEEFQKEATSQDNFKDQEKLQQVLAKAMQLNKDLLEAEKVIRQMNADNNRQQAFYNTELDKALRKTSAAQKVADKAKAGLIRVANTNQSEIKSLKRSLDRVQNELMTSNGRNMTRIKELERENQTLNAGHNNIQSKFDVILSKYEKLLKQTDSFDLGEERANKEKVEALTAKLHKTEGQLQQALALGKGLQGKLKNYEFHEQKSSKRLKELEDSLITHKKNEKQLLAATGKKINPETGEVEGGADSGKSVVESRDKLIIANNKVLDLKKRLHAVERDRDNYMRKLKTLEKGGSRTHTSAADSVPKQQHDRLEESFKLLGEDFKQMAAQLENSRLEVNEIKTKARTLEAKKQKLLVEIATLKKRNAA